MGRKSIKMGAEGCTSAVDCRSIFSGLLGRSPLRNAAESKMTGGIKRVGWALATVLFLALLFSGCAAEKAAPKAPAAGGNLPILPADAVPTAPSAGGNPAGMVFADDTGRSVTVKSCSRTVSLYGSFAETWTLAGGKLTGTTEDAVRERHLSADEAVTVVGTVKKPNLEKILSLSPDFVILSSEIPAQVSLDSALGDADIPHAFFTGNTFEEYLSMLHVFCGLTGREDLYRKNGRDVKEEIDAVLKDVSASGQKGPGVLLLRAYAGGCEPKGSDSIAGAILKELGAENPAETDKALSGSLGMEQIIAADPDYILIVVMGKEEGAKTYFEQKFEKNPAWAGLKAVRGGHFYILPKELFQYQPNARWGESYAYLAKLLYPGCVMDR